jgi:hypothetical protein
MAIQWKEEERGIGKRDRLHSLWCPSFDPLIILYISIKVHHCQVMAPTGSHSFDYDNFKSFSSRAFPISSLAMYCTSTPGYLTQGTYMLCVVITNLDHTSFRAVEQTSGNKKSDTLLQLIRNTLRSRDTKNLDLPLLPIAKEHVKRT